MRRLIGLGVVVLLLIVNTVVTDRETKPAEASAGGKIVVPVCPGSPPPFGV